MFDNIKENVKDWSSEAEVTDYLQKILDKKAFDGSGLIYGMGHAVYTLSDPREVILKGFARSLAEEKGRMEEFALYDLVERTAKKLIPAHRNTFKPVCANVDFYSGFVYTMLGIPQELFTPLFANCPYAWLECAPSGGTHQCRQDHPSGIQVCGSAPGVYSVRRKIKQWKRF